MLSLQRREYRQAWVSLVPILIAMFILTVWPLVHTLWLSFTDTALAGNGEATHYVQLDNYLYALTDSDSRATFARMLYFTVVSVTIEEAIGVLVALLLNQRFVGRNVLRVLVILPWALPTIVNAMMWWLNLNPDYGSVNALLSQLELTGSYHSWLGSPDSALHAAILADIWKSYPLVTLLVLATLQSVPDDLYEAARLDGASAWRRLRAITFPVTVGPLGVALALRTIDAFKVFDIIYIMTRSGPFDSTKTLSSLVHQESFSYLRAGNDAAYAMLMSLICAVLIALYLFLLLRQRLRSVDDET